MPSIALMTIHANFPWFRQIPHGKDHIGDWNFTLNSIAEDCALVVVYDEPLAAFACPLPIEQRVLITSEPPGMKRYYPGYANQFGRLMGPIDVPGFKGARKKMHPALAWFYGIGFEGKRVFANFDYDALAALPPPPKQEMVSIILSKKAKLPKHRARLRFVAEAQRVLGERVRVFGRGFEEVADKAEAIAPFAYHIVLENNDIPHFWTEKLADSLLGWALPIFSGCENLHADFPKGSFIPLDISNPRDAALRVKAILDDAPYQQSLPVLALARQTLIEKHNLFFVLKNIAEEIDQQKAVKTAAEFQQTLLPNLDFAPILRRLFTQLRKAKKHVKRIILPHKRYKP